MSNDNKRSELTLEQRRTILKSVLYSDHSCVDAGQHLIELTFEGFKYNASHHRIQNVLTSYYQAQVEKGISPIDAYEATNRLLEEALTNT